MINPPAGTLEERFNELESRVRQLSTPSQGTRETINDQVVLHPTAGAGWQDDGLTVDVLVTGGRLRVDVAASLYQDGGVTVYYGYRLTGPTDRQGPTNVDGTPGAVVAAPDDARAVSVYGIHANGGQYARPALHTGLAPGWYRLAGAMQRLAATTGNTNVANRQLLATPL